MRLNGSPNNGTGWVFNIQFYDWQIKYLETIGFDYAHSVSEFMRLLLMITPENTKLYDYNPPKKTIKKAKTFNFWEQHCQKLATLEHFNEMDRSSTMRGIVNQFCHPADLIYPIRNYQTIFVAQNIPPLLEDRKYDVVQQYTEPLVVHQRCELLNIWHPELGIIPQKLNRGRHTKRHQFETIGNWGGNSRISNIDFV